MSKIEFYNGINEYKKEVRKVLQELTLPNHKWTISHKALTDTRFTVIVQCKKCKTRAGGDVELLFTKPKHVQDLERFIQEAIHPDCKVQKDQILIQRVMVG